MKAPNLEHLKLFSAVVDAGGFRPAAHRTGLPASTISDLVRRVEEDLGVRLLHRNTRSVTPTEAGHRLLAQLRPALATIQHAVDGLRATAASPVGPLRLTVSEIVARYILPPILAGFVRAFPGVQVEVVVDNGIVDIVDGGFDAAIRYEEKVARDMIAVPIGPRVQRFVAAAAPTYLARHGDPDHPRNLGSHSLIGHRLSNGTMVVWEFAQGRRTVRVTPSGPLTTASIDLRIASAVSGAGLIYTFEEVLRPNIESGTLVPVLKDWWITFPGPLLCRHGDRHMPAPLQAFVRYVEAGSGGERPASRTVRSRLNG